MYKILIADDETDTRNLLVKYIRQKEPDLEIVGSVMNGEEALRVAEETRPDLVITDIFMPVMNGLEFLKAARDRGLTMKAAVISGYDEFAYAREAISLGVTEYLLKPFSPLELKEVIDKMKRELDSQRQLFENMKQLREQVDNKNILLKERILREILDGKYEEEVPPASLLDASQAYYCACLIKLPVSLKEHAWDFSRQENVEELLDLIGDGYFHKDIHVNGLSFDRQGAILILSGMAASGPQFLMKVKKGIVHLQQSLEKYYSMKILCVIGGIYDRWQELAVSYQEALGLWRGLLKVDKTVVVYGEQDAGKTERTDHGDRPAAPNSAGSADQITGLKEQILLAVRMGQEKHAMEVIDDLMKCYAALSGKKADYVSVSVEELVYAVSSDMENQGISHDDSRMKEQIANFSLRDIQAVLKEYIAKCCRLVVANQEKYQADRIVESVKYLIERNLDFENLTLEWLSAQLNFSANYVRQIFKQKTGESFMEYLIRKRMEKAGKLLKDTDMMIQDVAKVCGYSNQRYFASSFKKYYACTPTAFKSMIGQEEDGDDTVYRGRN